MTGKNETISSVKISEDLLKKASEYVKVKNRRRSELTPEELALIYRYQVACVDGEYIPSRDLAKVIGISYSRVCDAAREMRDAKNK